MDLRAEVAVPCAICGRPTTYTGTRRCNGCWELETRIEAAPGRARQILERVERGDERP